MGGCVAVMVIGFLYFRKRHEKDQPSDIAGKLRQSAFISSQPLNVSSRNAQNRFSNTSPPSRVQLPSPILTSPFSDMSNTDNVDQNRRRPSSSTLSFGTTAPPSLNSRSATPKQSSSLQDVVITSPPPKTRSATPKQVDLVKSSSLYRNKESVSAEVEFGRSDHSPKKHSVVLPAMDSKVQVPPRNSSSLVDRSRSLLSASSSPPRVQQQQSISKQQPSDQTSAKISYVAPSFVRPAFSSQSSSAQERQRVANMASIGAELIGDSHERFGRPFSIKQQLSPNMVGSASRGTLSSTAIQHNISSVSSGSAAVSTSASSAGFAGHLDGATVTTINTSTRLAETIAARNQYLQKRAEDRAAVMSAFSEKPVAHSRPQVDLVQLASTVAAAPRRQAERVQSAAQSVGRSVTARVAPSKTPESVKRPESQ